MAMRFSTKTALSLALSMVVGATAAHADNSYQPYYFDRNSVQYSNAPVQVPSNTTLPPSAAYVPAPPDDIFYHYNNEVWFAAGTSFLNYKETVAPIPDSERGWLPSVAVGGEYMTHDKLYLSLDGSVDVGNDDYKGATYDSNTDLYDNPAKSSTSSTIANADVKVGQGLEATNNVMLIPYGDLGFRYWDRNLGLGQEEYYHNFDALAGLMLEIAPTDRLMLSLYGSGGTTFGSRMSTGAGGYTYDLGSSAMEKAGGKVSYDLTQRIGIFTTFDYDHFHYTASDKVAGIDSGYVFEPGSRTSDTTMRVGVAYHFR